MKKILFCFLMCFVLSSTIGTTTAQMIPVYDKTPCYEVGNLVCDIVLMGYGSIG